MKKKVFAALLAGCMAVGLMAGCGSSSDDESTDTSTATSEASDESSASEETEETEETETTANGDYTFEVIVKSYQSTYWQAAVTGIDQAAEDYGVTVNTTGPNAESDIADQVNMLNSAINSAPDGIALAADDTSAVLDSLQTALDAGIPVVAFDTAIPEAPEGSVYATIATDSYSAAAIAADHLYEAIADQLGDGQVRIGEVNQDATSSNITDRGMGFIDEIITLAEADGYTVAVTGNDYYVNLVENNGDESTADIIIDVAVPSATTVELSMSEAQAIMNESDTIAMFGSNQVTAEGILSANENLNVLNNGIIAVGFDAGTTIKEAVADGTMYGAVTQAPVDQGYLAIETLVQICNGEEVEDITTDCYWYDASNMDDEDIAGNLYD